MNRTQIVVYAEYTLTTKTLSFDSNLSKANAASCARSDPPRRRILFDAAGQRFRANMWKTVAAPRHEPRHAGPPVVTAFWRAIAIPKSNCGLTMVGSVRWLASTAVKHMNVRVG